ncbi:exonuclease domain-containing protein [Salinisphaera sp.]|uniref:exonuclease domain-containing protein n=1 Tax=Salinisphaera sp. TaxID=1914330 RepID=UPI0025EA2BE9|nr:exonuclease domain-containing protein [Salinisphaera sp.]
MARPIEAPVRADRVPDFIAIDVETANNDAGSICQIGFATFADGALVDNWSWLINPRTWFSGHNIAIHGIRAADVADALGWDDRYDEIAALLAGRIVVSHTAFDVTATARACARHDLPLLAAQWLDSARVARRAFRQFARRGWGLASLSAHLAIDFEHHDAGEDARAAGLVVMAAVEASGRSVSDWLTDAHRPLREFA